jgi:hypothetical protein
MTSEKKVGKRDAASQQERFFARSRPSMRPTSGNHALARSALIVSWTARGLIGSKRERFRAAMAILRSVEDLRRTAPRFR